MDFNLSVVRGKTVHALVHQKLPEVVAVVREAYLAHGEGKSVNPNSYFLLFPEKPSARIIALPAYLGSRFDVSGIKWIASYPENVKKGFPRASAVLVLNDYETGYPFALLESSIISAARTAGSAVLAAELLHGGGKKEAKRLGMVGCGLIARYLYDFFLGMDWKIPELMLFDTGDGEAQRFAEKVVKRDRHQKVEIAPDVSSLVGSCDLSVFATVAPKPHVHDLSLFAHQPTVLNVSLRDLAPEILEISNNVVDDVDHVMKANTSPHLLEQKLGHRRFVNGTLAEVLTGKAKLDPSKPTIFSPFGLGILDLAVGKWAYDQAVASGEAFTMNDFFFELER